MSNPKKTSISFNDVVPFGTPLYYDLLGYADAHNEATSETQVDFSRIKTYGCKNLHKVKDIDDLLKQMYDNIDSHCLFEMNTDDLAKVWEVSILNTLNTVKSDESGISEYNKNGVGLFLKKRDSSTGEKYFVINSSYKPKADMSIGVILV